MAVTYWTGGGADDDFGTAGNWSAGLPGAGDTAIINDTSNAIVAETYATTFEELRVAREACTVAGSVAVASSGHHLRVRLCR